MALQNIQFTGPEIDYLAVRACIKLHGNAGKSHSVELKVCEFGYRVLK